MGSSLSIPDIEISPERTFLITGGNSGIGYETAKHIATLGGHVIIACRNMEKADAAITRMQAEYEQEFSEKMKSELEANKRDAINLDVEKMEVDLASFSSTMKFIQNFKVRNCSLNTLICNAGVNNSTKVITDDGYELMLQSNFLSHLLIILHFLPILSSSGADSRIVQTSSDGYLIGKVDLENMNGEKSFGAGGFFFYCHSKLYQILSMYWLVRHLKNNSVTISSCHPGFTDTQLTQSNGLLRFFVRFLARSSYDGARTIITAAIDPDIKQKTGVYYKNCAETSTTSYCRNEKRQEDLMKFSLDCIKQYLPSDVSDTIEIDWNL